MESKKLLNAAWLACLCACLLAVPAVGDGEGEPDSAQPPAAKPNYTPGPVAVGETWDFSAPPGAVVATNWMRRGAANDRFALSPPGWAFVFGDETVTNLTVLVGGRVLLPGGEEVAPFPAPLSMVPAANWHALGESNSPSLFWHGVADNGSLLLTWQNALFRRDATSPVSLQAELRPTGGVEFRYDFSRLASDGPLAGITPSADGVEPYVVLARNVAGVSFWSRSECLCIDQRAAFDESLHGLDPLSFPEGSTNTVLEHLFYSGTVDGPVTFPQPSGKYAVLTVSVSGTGRGDLLVDGKYVPLFGAQQRRGGPLREAPGGNALQFPVPTGRNVPLYLFHDGTLSVSLDSDSFAFGELPKSAAKRHAGWINFPSTQATEPCIHDFIAKSRRVSLPVGKDAEGLLCSWEGTEDVRVRNNPPRSAQVTALFDAYDSGSVTYTLSHPKRLFGQATFQQTVRFCPRPPRPKPDEPHELEEPAWYFGPGKEGEEEEPENYEFGSEPVDLDKPNCEDNGDADEVCPVHDVPYEQCAHLHAQDYTNAVSVATVQHGKRALHIREPPEVEEQILLEVPEDGPHCCPCPEHWSNHVAVACSSRRISVIDDDGLEFSSTGESCMVGVAGLLPSVKAGDAPLAFARNGEVYERHDYTVLGVAIENCGGTPLSRYNELAPMFGFPMSVCTNVVAAPELVLDTKVRLPSGTVHVELAGASAPFALWYRRRHEDEYRKLLDTRTCPAKDIPIKDWRRVIAGVAEDSVSSVKVRVTSASPGTVRLVFRYWAVVDGLFVTDVAEQRITSVKPPLLPDLDHNGNIDDDDLALSLDGRVFRFWVNEDTVKGDYVGESSDEAPNASDGVVNGAYDLVNLFPLAAELSTLYGAWGNQVVYRIEPESASPPGAFGFLWANIGRSGYRRMQTKTVCDLEDNVLAKACLAELPSVGYVIPDFVLEALSGSDGMLVAEAKSANASMRFVVRDGDNELFSYTPPLCISSVRKMYRWVDIRAAAYGPGGEYGVPYIPENRPDEECDGRHFVFVHGYNVNKVAARLWADTMFKRLWWSGSRSMFTAVDWRGDESQFSSLFHGDVTPDYYVNVIHAFASASVLAPLVASLPGARKVMLAHSLGNVLVSSAAKDHGLRYSRYYMLNAAVPVEAYDDMADNQEMVDSAWSNVPRDYRASDWCNLFGTNDFRSSLSWRGRFAGIPGAVNCYSETEEVLENPTLHGFGGAWAKQELFKGTAVWHGLNGTSFSLLKIACEGGWGINTKYAANPYYYVAGHGFIANTISNFSSQAAVRNPLFTPFREEADNMHSTNLFTIPDAVRRAELRAKFLADAIPALSFAAGANAILRNAVSDNIDYATCKSGVWPRNSGRWLHSDIKNVAYYFVWRIFQSIKDNNGGSANAQQQ